MQPNYKQLSLQVISELQSFFFCCVCGQPARSAACVLLTVFCLVVLEQLHPFVQICTCWILDFVSCFLVRSCWAPTVC